MPSDWLCLLGMYVSVFFSQRAHTRGSVESVGVYVGDRRSWKEDLVVAHVDKNRGGVPRWESSMRKRTMMGRLPGQRDDSE